MDHFKIVTNTFKIAQDIKLVAWNKPSLKDFVFQRLLDDLGETFPVLTETAEYLKTKGKLQFGARAYLPKVSYISQLQHSLSPQHIPLHSITLLGAKTGKVLSVKHDQFSARVNMVVKLISGLTEFEAGFNGPLCFTVDPKQQASLVFMITPLREGHIIEMGNFAPKLSPSTNHLPALAAFVFRLLPRIFRFLFFIAYVEDLPYYSRKDNLEQLIAQIKKSHQQCCESSNADTTIQSHYYKAYEQLFENGSFEAMLQAAQELGASYIHEGFSEDSSFNRNLDPNAVVC
jgi:hypothetical protein